MNTRAQPDADRTVNIGGTTQPVLAGAATGPPDDAPATADNALPPGTRIAEFIVEKVLGIGGFGIVYLAADVSLGRKVALKEYMPEDYAVREAGVTVSVKSSRHAETFSIGLRSFINEARLLAQFNHPSLVKVHRFWEANGTAYMVMPYYEGKTLKDTLAQMSEPPTQAWLRGLLGHLLDALAVIHAEQCFHRDIAPDNIVMTRDCPVLLDFGAARRLIEEKNQAVTAIVKRSYAPIEQYGQSEDMTQGAWTDLYALASVMYLAIMRKLPPTSMDRVVSDTFQPLATAAPAAMPGRYSAGFLDAIDRALALRPKDRPQSVAEFYALLERKGSVPRRAGPQPDAAGVDGRRRLKPAHMAAGGMGVIAAILMAWMMLGEKVPTPSGSEVQKDAVVPAHKLPVTPPAIEKPPFHPARLLEDVVRGRSNSHDVTVVVEKGQVVIGKDLLRFKLRSAKAGYVYVLMLDANQSHLSLLYPPANEKNNRIEAGKELQLPPAGWNFQAQGPPGTDQFVVLVSDTPRDFAAAGVNADGEFPLATAAKLYDAFSAATPFFAGTARCDAGAPCAGAYGAAAFSIEEIQKK